MAQREIALLPEKLLWQPGSPSSGSVLALDLCAHGGGKPGIYRVTHYSRESLGAAFGPLDLALLVRFCGGLAEALDSASGPVRLTTPKGDAEYLANASVLVGAYLLLRCGWNIAQLSAVLDSSEAKFACSWAAPGSPVRERVMSVRDCWLGIELALKQGWLRGDAVTDTCADKLVEQYCTQVLTYDATWLIPGLLMVGADPTTVICDPNPATCKRLGAQEKAVCEKVVNAQDTCSPTKSGSTWATPIKAESSAVTPSKAVSTSSVDTVCKEYLDEGKIQTTPISEEPLDMSCDYASFFRLSGISLIVRANFDFEPGMPKGRSYGSAFTDQGFEQIDVRVVDQHGGMPRRRDVARMLEACEGYMLPNQAIFVHCKGGFGRSVVLACCLAIYRLDVPGSAMLGWARIARPGAITTRAQEVFLRQLSGSIDVARYAGMATVTPACTATSCMTACSMQ